MRFPLYRRSFDSFRGFSSAGRSSTLHLPAPPQPAPQDEILGDLPLASDYFDAIEHDPDLPTVTWVVGERGTESDVFEADEPDPLGLSSVDDDVRDVLHVVRESL